MKHEKFIKKLHELLEHSELGEQNSFGIKIDNKCSRLIGFGKESLQLNDGLVIMEKDGELNVLGYFDNKRFNYTPTPKKENTETEEKDTLNLLIGIDNRNSDNRKVYIVNQGSYYFINKDTELNSNDKIYIYWQYGLDTCLTIVGYDLLSDKIICDYFFSNSQQLTNKLKLIIRHMIQLIEQKSEV